MKLSRQPLNYFDFLWLCGYATNLERQRAARRVGLMWGPLSRTAARVRPPAAYSTRRSMELRAASGTYTSDLVTNYDLD